MQTSDRKSPPQPASVPITDPAANTAAATAGAAVREIGGPAGPEPTRFGDWEKNGRCIDF
ncbi:MAG TPA: DUF1674 domain-containing protein [Steroidobacteraceae bacterium]